jgi:folate-dependent phosphoribosylglycinamide formyltransferase PurN
VRPLADASPPLSVAVLVSESDARLRSLLGDPGERPYDLVGAVASHDGDAADALRARDVPVELEAIDPFYAARDAPLSDREVRTAYDERVAAALARFDPDVVVCSGYRFVLTAPVLERFAPRIVSAHHADLTIRADGEPKYPGLRATRDAIRDGRPVTRETTHVVTPAVDRGPPLVRSRPFPVHEDLVASALERDAADVLDAYVYAHREWMLRAGGGPTLETTLELIAEGRVELRGDRAYVDGEPGPYSRGETPRTRPAGIGGR